MEEFFGFRNFRQFERTRREIKLPYDLLNDIRFRQLPDAQKAHLICLLLLSARMNNLLPNSPVKLERLIGATEPLDLSAFADFVDFAGGGKADLAGPLCEPARARQHARGGAGARRRTMSKMSAGDQPGNGSHCSGQQGGQDRRIESADPVPTL